MCVLLQEDLMRIRIIYNVGYGLSLICLLLAVFIMIFFKWVYLKTRNKYYPRIALVFYRNQSITDDIWGFLDKYKLTMMLELVKNKLVRFCLLFNFHINFNFDFALWLVDN